MPKERSFKEYVAFNNEIYNTTYKELKRYIYINRESLTLNSAVVHSISYVELSDIYTIDIIVSDQPGTRIAFDVIVDADIEVKGYGRRDWETDSCSAWFLISCSGDLSVGLDDFKIHSIKPYDRRKYVENPLSDALVPYIHSEELEDVAEKFLSKFYPEALKTPMKIDTNLLTERMELTVIEQQITEDFSIFGQIFFSDTEAEIYNPEKSEIEIKRFSAGTIVVDPQTFQHRNIGSANNTVVHECVHWHLHKKAYELERLYNESANQIKCTVVGGIKGDYNTTANEWMEWQASTLAPRILMPLNAFKIKATELIHKHKNLQNTTIIVDVMEPVIDELADFFGVSRTAAKIRLIDAGYEEAIGAFTYIDGRYVKPHAFKKGTLKRTQTFCISFKDALCETMINPDLCDKFSKGDYVYIDSHICINDPMYVTHTKDEKSKMTEYGRLHMDECCLIFDLNLKSSYNCSAQFHNVCILHRDLNSGYHFEAVFSPKTSEKISEKSKILRASNHELYEILKTLNNSFSDSSKKLMEIVEITVEELAEKIDVSPKTIQRLRNGENENPNTKTVVAMCIAMKLPPDLSMHLIETSGHRFKITEEDLVYKFLIRSCYTTPLEECNQYLINEGFEPLTKSNNVI